MAQPQKPQVTTKFFEALTILFIALKLIGVIDWGWFLVLSPILLQASVTLAILLLVVLWHP